MKRIKRHVDDAAALAGVVLIAAGLAGWSWPAALVWLGACCLAVAWALTRED